MIKASEIKRKKVCVLNLNSNYKLDIFKVFRKSDDYFYLMEGKVAEKSDVETFLIDVPPNKNLDDKILLGIFYENELIGVLDIVKNFPKKHEWIIGLFLIIPEYRNMGIGKFVHKMIVNHFKDDGLKKLRVGVGEKNIKALNYWKSLGYREVLRTEPRKFGKKKFKIIVMNYLLDSLVKKEHTSLLSIM